MNKNQNLNELEIDFCYLYVNGGYGVAGNYDACYKEAFGETDKRAVRSLIRRPEIQECIKEQIEEFKNNKENQDLAMELRVRDTLVKVMDETSKDVYSTPKGHKLSPAPLRAVSVNAAKALMDMQRKSGESQLSIQTQGSAGVVFNVVVPNAPADDEEYTEE